MVASSRMAVAISDTMPTAVVCAALVAAKANHAAASSPILGAKLSRIRLSRRSRMPLKIGKPENVTSATAVSGTSETMLV